MTLFIEFFRRKRTSIMAQVIESFSLSTPSNKFIVIFQREFKG